MTEIEQLRADIAAIREDLARARERIAVLEAKPAPKTVAPAPVAPMPDFEKALRKLADDSEKKRQAEGPLRQNPPLWIHPPSWTFGRAALQDPANMRCMQ